jgi:NADH:ubiquinone oxidoreductase subunit 3 (subunit A)
VELLVVAPLVFGVYLLALLGLRALIVRRERPSALYASGESHPSGFAVPGYRPFYITALFFAVLHLGALILATGTPSPISLLYLTGLTLSLLALLLG